MLQGAAGPKKMPASMFNHCNPYLHHNKKSTLMSKLSILKRTGIMALAITLSASLFAQPNGRDTSRSAGARPSNGPKPYKEVITSRAVTDEGLFKVHKVGDKYFFEIPDGLLGRDILAVNRISRASAGMRSGFFGYAGDQINQNVIRFEKGPNHKVFLRSISFAEYAKDSTSPMFTAVTKSNVHPIAASFDIKTFAPDSMATVIDITDYISGDNDILFFHSSIKSSQRIGAIQNDKSYIGGVRSYPINVEINTVKTYARTPAPSTPATAGRTAPVATGNITVELNSSLVLLPKEPMQPRYFDRRVGYFAVGYTDFDMNPQGVKSISMIKRWRLEPRPEDLEKYKRGELVEPAKPIIFYIDPATPAKWVPYLIQGVNDWQKAFEKAGFKNAIIGKMAPSKAENPEWSLEDARYSAIVYKPSDIGNASGPSISDPRSGEIMESHINWYHNVMELLRNWYFIQCAAVDPAARKMTFEDELMGQLIRFVSSHEVGHTLGLRHNYGASAAVPVENLRNKAWVEANGHTPSIMDYARFNYVAQPEDNIGQQGLFPRIGVYDEWAIEWGYKHFPQYKSAEAERGYLNTWVIEKLKDQRYWFGTETNPDDPRSQREQVGDDPILGSDYGIRNLKRIMANLIDWTREPNESYDGLRDMHGQAVGQMNNYTGHVAKYVGGIMETPKTVEQQGPVYEIVPEQKQKEAIAFLHKHLFTTPTWMVNQEIMNRTGLNALSTIAGMQDRILSQLLSSRTMGKLIDAEAVMGSKTYQVTELLRDLKNGIWSELAARKTIDVYRRSLQKSYVNMLGNLLTPSPAPSASGISIVISSSVNIDRSDIRSVVRAHLASLRSEIISATGSTTDPMSRYHLQDLAVRIDRILNPKN